MASGHTNTTGDFETLTPEDANDEFIHEQDVPECD